MNKLVFVFLLLGIFSCQKDPQDVNDEELITKLIYTLKSTSDNDEVVMTFSDRDGNGGNAPIITTSGFLQKGKIYEGSISLLNESLNPIEDLTLEIEEEDLDHQFFYILSNELSPSVYGVMFCFSRISLELVQLPPPGLPAVPVSSNW